MNRDPVLPLNIEDASRPEKDFEAPDTQLVRVGLDTRLDWRWLDLRVRAPILAVGLWWSEPRLICDGICVYDVRRPRPTKPSSPSSRTWARCSARS